MSGAEATNAAQAEYWEARSSSWIEIEAYTALTTGPFGRLAMDRLPLEAGHKVLDVGCGSGPTTVELAQRVAPGGTAVGIDIAPSMIDAARARAHGARAVAEFIVGDAQTYELGDGSFDAVFSRFGVMFFADLVAAFTNLRLAMRDGGRLAFACWQEMAANEWMLVPGEAVTAVTGASAPMPAPGQPGPFLLSGDGLAAQVLEDAGFHSVEVVRESARVVVPADRIDFAVEASCRLGSVREALAANEDPAFHAEIRSALRVVLTDRVRDGQLVLKSAGLVVTATA